MKRKKLIQNIEYNYRNLENKDGSLDGNSALYNNIELIKDVYNSNEIVNITKNCKDITDDIVNSFIDTFSSRGGATKDQIYFAKETSQIIYGKLKENIITVIPAPCGFGKSSITLEILKKQIKLYKDKKTSNGIIIATDRLESLRHTEDCLNKMGLGGYTYILEGWNEKMCINKKVKKSDDKICTSNNCPFYERCKIFTQKYECMKYPILLITNARLRECAESIKMYNTYNIDKNNKGERNLLLIDERPDMLDTVKVNKSLLNKISTDIDKCKYETTDDKTKLQNKWKDIEDTIISKMQRLRQQYKRFIISNINNDNICENDMDFITLWDKYIGKNYKRELQHIHDVLTKGGLYVYEGKNEFISTIGSKNLREIYCDTFKTIIFDGTALYDPLYLGMYDKGDLKFLDIQNTRLYDNLTINVYNKHKLNRYSFSEKKYLINACAKFINNKMLGFNKSYVVTYGDQSVQLANLLKHKVNIPMPDEGVSTYYFGATKGENSMQDCTKMFMVGWHTLPDYEYVIQWLSTSIKWEKTLVYCTNIENAEKLSDDLIFKDRSREEVGNNTYTSFGHKIYEFGLPLLNQFKALLIVTDFYQEVHRTKLRNYQFKDKIEIHIFQQKKLILDMIENLFATTVGKKVIVPFDKELKEFKESKNDNRANKGQANTKFTNWLEKQDKNREVTTKDLYNETGLTKKQLDKLRENNNYIKEWFIEHTVKRGKYLI
ncbi:hypothetical protein CPAST_c34890 [Clostridium pasteurianum DSM 525 = ATCC 6013]|uniref:Uncharacterized protein n=1 Tax=Clostridium pasteurianum DSM 525 = ATCC 6013 TaxID=1262449 RepID=A0A0H3JBD7_CLOPA|nr:hypothetical protein [Clostridium pasteurianum]AJA49550.1 hypothetical protein CPAST_c34890 [Clostridium pasteurianum DSM 525 = ATCC 6013]AJA53538.1 hypothetical protein CLPA_c34890 [Clostridium pasteurianum DSM 525 = ATCC 6013]AOZ76705.1 hypothetical protein AQ983_16945 [Clostridium pasteurianum DSM 525 = ATCC 6013]AOZ80502.1 hypothetical protein AQ984_16940 [Clostridium pasteurianum]ELP58933.1 hypothetical protein F502_12431 [Clostridium pasteurianum DSM 525 = ATCC 6013]